MTAATVQPRNTRFCTVIDGNGRMSPSPWMFANRVSNSSSIDSDAQEPSSRTPTNTTPGFPFLGRSFANAQMFRRIFLPSEALSFRSTRSDSMSDMSSSSSASV